MDMYRFFEEYRTPAKAQSTGKVIAVPRAGGSFIGHGEVCLDTVRADPDVTGDAPVLATLCAAEYLGTHCLPVTEARARAIHPALFAVLDAMA